MKILIVGKTGQLSWELQRSVSLLGTVECVGRPEMDLTSPDSVRNMLRRIRPNILINAAAYTAVDKAEAEPSVAMKVNAEAPAIMAREMKAIRGLLVHYSTDFVYDGAGSSPYIESDRTGPLNVYGTAKLAGDDAVVSIGGAYLIFRTSWVYGAHGYNFLRSILRMMQLGKPLRVVDDQTGSPTWSRDIAIASALAIAQVCCNESKGNLKFLPTSFNRSGIYNLSSRGFVTWYSFATAILEQSQKLGLVKDTALTITPIASCDYPTPAKRPHNSRLSNEKLQATFGIALPHWRDSLIKVIEEIANPSTR